MSAQHTPGRLVAEELDQDADYAFVIRQIDGDPYPLPVADCNRPADARRLVACWNACEGISIESLERSDVLAGLNAQRAQLTAQRDDLLEALAVVQAQCESMAVADWRKWEELASPEEFERWVKSRAAHMAVKAHAAIAKVKGGAA